MDQIMKISILSMYKPYAKDFFKSKHIYSHSELDEKSLELEIKSDSSGEIDDEDIAQEITQLILKIMKEKILKEYIEKIYKTTYNEDGIYEQSLEVFKKREIFIQESLLVRVHNYILSENYINIDGFLKFRMKEFMKYVYAIGDIGAEEYLIKKDQDEFMNVMKYFIEIQEEKIDLVRVHILKNNNFILYDKEGNKIENINNEEIMNIVIKENMNYEDFLVSTLLTLCPKKIEILDSLNSQKSLDIIDIIKSIFGEKVHMVYEN